MPKSVLVACVSAPTSISWPEMSLSSCPSHSASMNAALRIRERLAWPMASGPPGRALSGRSHSTGVRMIRKLTGGEYRIYSRKLDPKTKKRKNLGTFKTRAAAEKHERAVQYFKRH